MLFEGQVIAGVFPHLAPVGHGSRLILLQPGKDLTSDSVLQIYDFVLQLCDFVLQVAMSRQQMASGKGLLISPA